MPLREVFKSHQWTPLIRSQHLSSGTIVYCTTESDLCMRETPSCPWSLGIMTDSRIVRWTSPKLQTVKWRQEVELNSDAFCLKLSMTISDVCPSDGALSAYLTHIAFVQQKIANILLRSLGAPLASTLPPLQHTTAHRRGLTFRRKALIFRRDICGKTLKSCCATL